MKNRSIDLNSRELQKFTSLKIKDIEISMKVEISFFFINIPVMCIKMRFERFHSRNLKLKFLRIINNCINISGKCKLRLCIEQNRYLLLGVSTIFLILSLLIYLLRNTTVSALSPFLTCRSLQITIRPLL